MTHICNFIAFSLFTKRFNSLTFLCVLTFDVITLNTLTLIERISYLLAVRIRISGTFTSTFNILANLTSTSSTFSNSTILTTSTHLTQRTLTNFSILRFILGALGLSTSRSNTS